MPKGKQGASPQVENGYLKVANELIEAVYRANLSPHESRVFWFIIRLTYGWNKKTDWIALSQFTDGIESKGLPGTGLDRRHAHRALVRLRKKEMVVTCKDDKNHVSYGIQKDYTKWRGFSEEKTVIRTDDKVSSIQMTKVSSVQAPTKDSKRNIKKTPLPPNGGMGMLEDLFSKKYKQRSGEDYVWDRKSKRLVTKDEGCVSSENAEGAIDIYFRLDTGYNHNTDLTTYGYNYVGFHQRLNKLVGEVKRQEEKRRCHEAYLIQVQKEREEEKRRRQEDERLRQKLEELPEDDREALRQQAEATVKTRFKTCFGNNETSIRFEMLKMLKEEEEVAVLARGP